MFEVGDRIVGNKEAYAHKSLKGEIGTIVCVGEDWAVVEFDNYINGHDGGNLGKDGHCWGLPPNKLERLVENNRMKLQQGLLREGL